MLVNADTSERMRQIYIKPKSSITLTHLDPGNYRAVFAMGFDWNREKEHFNRDASYFDFAEVLPFRETRDSRYLRYESHTITLNPVLEGSVSSRHISEDEFHALAGPAIAVKKRLQ